MRPLAEEDDDRTHMKSLVEEERIAAAVDTLLRGSQDAVAAMSHAHVTDAVQSLQNAVVQELARSDDFVRQAVLERNLARGLVRWMCFVA
jgi:ClpP class serine protease